MRIDSLWHLFEKTERLNEQSSDQTSSMEAIDHLVYATPDLEKGVERIEKLTGVRATMGGRHPQWGTHNAVLALGDRQYLEIVAPDPNADYAGPVRIFRLDELLSPGLVSWAAATGNIERIREKVLAQGLRPGPLLEGNRRMTDGKLLSWRLTDPMQVLGDGLLPFLIDWGSSEHPAISAVKGCRLLAFRGRHPQPEKIRHMLDLFQLDLPVSYGPRPELIATINCPVGIIELK